MAGLSLHHLDQRTVAVEFPVAAEIRVVKGRGQMVCDQSSGAALHVIVQELAEEFQLIFHLQQFTGLIERGERFACDFAIRLRAGGGPAFLPAA